MRRAYHGGQNARDWRRRIAALAKRQREDVRTLKFRLDCRSGDLDFQAASQACDVTEGVVQGSLIGLVCAVHLSGFRLFSKASETRQFRNRSRYPEVAFSDALKTHVGIEDSVITSFALLVVLHTIMVHWSAMTNGPRTLFGVPKVTGLYLAAGFAIGAIGLALAFKESRTGLLLRAVRDDEAAAEATGAHVSALRWRGFVLSALMAGLGGALWGHFITSFSPPRRST